MFHWEIMNYICIFIIGRKSWNLRTTYQYLQRFGQNVVKDQKNIRELIIDCLNFLIQKKLHRAISN